MQSDSGPTVFVVDDDPAVRESLARSLEACGHRVEAYGSASEFLDATGGTRPGCLVLDVRMPDISGLELQERMQRMGSHLPIIFVTGHGDIPMAVQALKQGAVDFLEKPYDFETLLTRIQEALAEDSKARRAEARERRVRERLASLTDREREIFRLLTHGPGASNKAVARALGISHRTVEVHRGRIMRKMEADSMAELMHLAEICSNELRRHRR